MSTLLGPCRLKSVVVIRVFVIPFVIPQVYLADKDLRLAVVVTALDKF